jgi:hypothetical protein
MAAREVAVVRQELAGPYLYAAFGRQRLVLAIADFLGVNRSRERASNFYLGARRPI